MTMRSISVYQFEPDTENLNNISNDLSDFMNGLNVKSVEEV